MAQLNKILASVFIFLFVLASLISCQCSGKRPISEIHQESLGRKSMMRRRFYNEQELQLRESHHGPGARLGESDRAIPSGPDPIHHRITLHN